MCLFINIITNINIFQYIVIFFFEIRGVHGLFRVLWPWDYLGCPKALDELKWVFGFEMRFWVLRKIVDLRRR